MKRVLLCVVLMACSGMASAVVYKWVDAQGKVQYGDRPPDGVHAEVVELLGTHLGRSTKTDAPAPAAAKNSAVPAADLEAKKAVQNDVAQTRDKQCAEAQERYKKLIEGRHLYKPGDNGERKYLTSEEIDSERVDAKREIDAICNSST
jgi:Domain of unknown function (DUF4124)